MEFIEQKFKAVDNFFSSFRAAFEGQKEKRTKCPRCKGSGLMTFAGNSYQKKGHASYEPCWFCEGVGILPIIGLEGFLLARASSQVNTCDLTLCPLPPVPLEQSLVNPQGTKCKFTKYKPAVQIYKFPLDVSETLPWLAVPKRESELSNSDLLSNHSLCGTLDSLSNQTQVKIEKTFPSESTSVMDSFKTSNYSHNVNFRFIRGEAWGTSKSSIDVKNELCPAFLGVPLHNYTHSQSHKGRKMGLVEKGFDTSNTPHFTHKFGGISSLDLFLIASALKPALQKKRSYLQTSPFNDCILIQYGREAIHFDLALPTARHDKMHRNSRRRRNCIREKAQKEANENARRILQSLTPRKTDMFTPSSNETSEDALSDVSTNGGEATEILVRSETSKSFPFFKLQHERSIMDRAGSTNLWMKNFSSQLFKAKGLSITKPMNVLKN